MERVHSSERFRPVLFARAQNFFYDSRHETRNRCADRRALTDQLVTQIESPDPLAPRARRREAAVDPATRRHQHISRFPVIEAYDRLASRGLIQPGSTGSGFYVASHIVDDEDRRPGGCDPRLAEEEIEARSCSSSTTLARR